MYKRILVDDSVAIIIETRATGRVRFGMEHPAVDLQRATMDPVKALEVAQAMIQAGNTAATVHMQKNTGEGGQVASPQRATQWPFPVGHKRQRGRVNWCFVSAVGVNLAAWSVFIALCAVASGWRPC